MALRKYKPITAGTRWRIGNAYAEITTNKPEKSLLEPQKKTAGRNFQGRRAMRYMGGVTDNIIVSSILKETKLVWKLQLFLSSTIQTELHLSH